MGQLAGSIRDLLNEQSSDLVAAKDTDAYRGALVRLNGVMEEGYQHLRQKNIELWKVHSDEATRCALRENRVIERHCGLVCLFNKVPRVHKKTSERNLFECF